MMRRRGFTLIEFLVVTALIGILAILGMGAYTRSLSRGRDAKRISDMKEVQKAFELYYSLNSNYNSSCDAMFTDETGKKPTPPNGSLTYINSCSLTGYTYCAQLENGTEYANSVCADPNQASTCSVSGIKPTHYCVFNVQ